MSIKKFNQHHIEDLLKQTFKDDLTPEVENRLNIKLSQFQEKTRRQEKNRLNYYEFMKNFFNSNNPLWRSGPQFIKNAALIFAIVVFIILMTAAGFVPITGSPGILAESISVLTTSLHVSEQIFQVDTMTCSGEAISGEGERLLYSINWTPERTCAQIITANEIIVKTLLVKNDHVTIIDNINKTVRHGRGIKFIDDPLFQPIIQYISPANLRERLQVKWATRSYQQRGDCDEGTFAFSNPLEKGNTEVIVDMCSFLPSRIIKYIPIPTTQGEKKQIVMSLNFSWETQFIPRIIDQNISIERK